VVTHTVGEAVLSSFPDARSAVKAALDVQRRLAALDGNAKLRVRVRAGLSFGPVRVIAGKVSGDAVSAAGTLLEKARPGEVLADQAVKDALGQFDYVKLIPYGPVQGVSAYRVAEAGSAAPDHSATQVIQPRPDFAPAAKPAAAPAPAPQPAAPPAPIAAPAPAPVEAPAPAPAVAPAPQVSPSALVLRYGEAERRFSSADGEVMLGRALENHINVPVPHVSRRHAKIVWEGSVPVLVNLSQNGSCVRFDGTGRQMPCDTRMELRGSGGIALAGRFGESPTGADVVYFRVG
jgi:adenylate cyclase